MKKVFLLLLLAGFAASAQQKMLWPHHKKAVIVLTYDDALESQLDIAVPQLQKAGFRSTFFLTGDINAVTIPRWRKLAHQGFELANHTMFHPCAVLTDNPVSSEKYTIRSMLLEIENMNHLLFAVDGQYNRTYAYPCTETTIGGKDYVDSLKHSGLIKYARIGGDVDDAIITDFGHLNPLLVPAYGLEENTPGEKLIAFVKQVEEKGGMGVFMFHGVGGDYITTQAAAHQQLIDYLKQHRKEIWVATFQQAMDYITLTNKGEKPRS